MNATVLKRLLIAAISMIILTGCGLLSGVTYAVPRLFAQQPTLQVAQPAQPEVVAQAPADNPPAQPPAASNTVVQTTPLEQTYIQLYEKVNPSVVNIRVVEGVSTSSNNNQAPDLPFPQIPGLPNLPNGQGQPAIPAQAEGSGFIYDQNGYIVTNNHVVDGATKIVVTFYDGSEAAARLIGVDPSSDLAVIKVDVDPSMIVPVPLGSSDQVKVGQMVIAIGNPFGNNNSMTTGIVSGLGRMLSTNSSSPSGGQYSIPDMIQTDTAINPGNSGGPLLNLSGEVIGVNTAIATNVGTNSGVGYSIPADIIRQVVEQIIANGSVEHPWLGISGRTLNADLAKAMNLDPSTRGVLIAEVLPNGPSAQAGLQPSTQETTIDGIQTTVGGDVITAIDGQPVKVFDDLLGYIFGHSKVGDTITLDILRNGQPMQVQLTLQARPSGL